MEFREFLIEDDYQEFNETLDLLIQELEQTGTLNEGLLSSLTAKVKGGIEFIKEFTKLIGAKLLDILKIFKEKAIFAFFSKLKWSMKALVNVVKKRI